MAAEVSENDNRGLWDALEATLDAQVTVDLEQQTITCSEHAIMFSIDPSVKQRLLDGTDNIATTLRSEPAIARFDKARPA